MTHCCNDSIIIPTPFLSRSHFHHRPIVVKSLCFPERIVATIPVLSEGGSTKEVSWPGPPHTLVAAILMVFPGLPLQGENFSSIPLFFFFFFFSYEAPVGRNRVGYTDRRTLMFSEHMVMKQKCIINLATTYHIVGFSPILARTEVNLSVLPTIATIPLMSGHIVLTILLFS
jgi:hypothetical protein